MSSRRPRRPSAEDKALWDRIARTTTPMSGRPAPHKHHAPNAQSPKPKVSTAPQNERLPQFRIGEKASGAGTHLHPRHALTDRLVHAPVRMDHGTHRKMLRGKLKPEARIDLHGQTLAQAHPALNRFILDAHAQGKRLVLVITGKGKDRDEDGPIPVRRGVLRRQVPMWLQTPPMGFVVLDVCEAHLRHGGHGAYYVYLKRPF